MNKYSEWDPTRIIGCNHRYVWYPATVFNCKQGVNTFGIKKQKL